MDDCEFCQIIAGERDAHVLLETDQAVAFLDANPAVEGHTLVVPASHHEFLFTDDETPAVAVMRVIHQVSLSLNRAMEPDGVSVFYTSAELVGRITHAHVHLLPRFADDGIRLALERNSLDEDEAPRLANRIRTELQSTG